MGRCRGHAGALDRQFGAAALCLVCALFWAGHGAYGALVDSRAFVTTSVLMGAAAGYVLIGLLGGVLLNTLYLLHPVAFGGLPLLPMPRSPLRLELLTTVGSGALVSSNLRRRRPPSRSR